MSTFRKPAALLALLLALVLCLSACVSKAPADNGSAPADDGGDAASAEDYLNSFDTASRDLAEKYFDFDAYTQNAGKIKDNRVKNDIISADVDEIMLVLGMSYDEVIEHGFTPKDKDLAEKTMGGAISKSHDFLSPAGKIVSLQFAGKEGKKIGTGTLYRISMNSKTKENSAVLVLDGVSSETATIREVIDAFGNAPVSIETIKYGESMMLSVTYRENDRQVYINFGFDPADESVYHISIEGSVSK